MKCPKCSSKNLIYARENSYIIDDGCIDWGSEELEDDFVVCLDCNTRYKCTIDIDKLKSLDGERNDF